MLKAFKEFAMKGNMLDMAVGSVIGAAFGTVVKSLVDNIIMPPIGKLTAGIDLKKENRSSSASVSSSTTRSVS